MEEELNYLKNELLLKDKQIENEIKKRKELDEECDLLAFENDRLKGELAKALLQVSEYKLAISLKDNNDKISNDDIVEDCSDILMEGNGKYVTKEISRLNDVCNGANALCSIFTNNDGIIACGGADRAITFCSIDKPTSSSSLKKLFSINLSSPILTMDQHNSIVAAGMMDGKHIIIDLNNEIDKQNEDKNEINNEDINLNINNNNHNIINNHNKYVIAIKWSSDGEFLATGSYDKSVNLYKKLNSTNELIKISVLRYLVNVESVTFIQTEGGQQELVVALRDTAYLVYVHCETLQERHISLNVSSWDTHVSFTPLYLSPCPNNNKYLAIGTDKNMIITLRSGSNQRVRTFVGHNSGDYAKPKISWDSSGRYLYSNSENDSSIYTYSVGSEKVVSHLKGHKGIVRDISCHSHFNQVISVGHDKTLILWE
jgi:WD40 repeat protein